MHEKTFVYSNRDERKVSDIANLRNKKADYTL